MDQDGKVVAKEGADPHTAKVIPLMTRLKSVLQETHSAVRSAVNVTFS